MTSGSLLADRWEILRPLGTAAAGQPHGAGRPQEAFLARELSNGREVVVKLLHLDRMSGWKELELFQREAEALKGIRHERVPALLDAFRLEEAVFVLVREFVPGASLQEKVSGGWRATEGQITRIGAELAGIVGFLHSLRPPVIHRDINPNNVILDDGGEVHLVDFGSVQDPRSGPAAATVVGTPGYAAFEQFVGRATPRSDLYAVAATLLFLLTHRNPADLPSVGMKPDFRSAAAVSAPLARVLDNWLEPDEEKRTLPVEEAAALLAGSGPLAGEPAGRPAAPPDAGLTPPSGSRIRVRRVPGGVEFRIPERGRGPGEAALAGFSVFWLGFVGFWTHAAIAMRAPLFFPLFSIPFWGAGLFLAWRALTGLFGSVTISLGPGGLTFTRRLFFLSRSLSVPLAEMGSCVFDEGRSASRGGALRLEAGARVLVFGGGLSRREGQWLQAALNDRARGPGRALTAFAPPVHPGS